MAVGEISGIGSTNILDGMPGLYSALVANENGVLKQNVSKAQKLNLGSGTISSLFDLSETGGNATLADLQNEFPGLKMFVIVMILVAKAEEGTTESLVASLNAARQTQTLTSQNLITMSVEGQKAKETLAKDQANWTERAGISASGSQTKEDVNGDTHGWQVFLRILMVVLVVAVVIVAIGLFISGVGAGAAVGLLVATMAILMAVSGILSAIQTATTGRASYRNLGFAASLLNPVDNIVELVSDGYTNLDENKVQDQKLQRVKMGLKIGLSVAMAVAMIIGAIFSFGSTTAAVIASLQKVASLILIGTSIAEGAVKIATSILEIRKGVKELEFAKRKYVISQMEAELSKMKLDLDTLSQEVDLIIDMFSASMEDVKNVYEKATKILKEYNDQTRAVARNFKA
ncbi:MAG: hypothetical protein LBI56_02725 [Puniceicoccales bacterium]|nr:hypothetical protein [Puniceicoccales bacterium]